MKYEYGYLIVAGGETKETVLGTCGEAEVAQTRREIERANEAERGPDIKGLVRPQTSFWFVREASDPSAPSVPSVPSVAQ